MKSLESMSKAHAMRSLLQTVAWAVKNEKMSADDVPSALRRIANRCGNRKPVHRGQPRQRIRDDKNRNAVIRAALEADPTAPYWQIAAKVECDQTRVAEVARRMEYERITSPEKRKGGRKAPRVEFPEDLVALFTQFMRRDDDEAS